jgi:hypothetical protein
MEWKCHFKFLVRAQTELDEQLELHISHLLSGEEFKLEDDQVCQIIKCVES